MSDPLPFADRPSMRSWLDAHHASEPKLCVLIHKAATGRASVTWEDCVIEALRVGWIDGVKRGAGAEAWVQRLTPRRRGSIWSQRNRAHAERLIPAGEMTAPGLAQVEAARADGRRKAAYPAPRNLSVALDFLLALESRPCGRARFQRPHRRNL